MYMSTNVPTYVEVCFGGHNRVTE